MLDDKHQTNLESFDDLKGPRVEHPKVPVIYAPSYNPALQDIEGWHPLDFNKREKIFEAIRDALDLQDEHFYIPEEVAFEDLIRIHSVSYLKSLEDTSYIAKIFQIPELAAMPIAMLDDQLLRPMRIATGGTLKGVELALQYGWAINLSGGFHHAAGDRGEGFCFYSDLALAALKAKELCRGGEVLILDLDAHQGNGTSRALYDREGIVIMDVYNRDIYPGDSLAQKRVDYNVPLPSGTSDDEYLPLVQQTLQEILESRDIRCIIYNAGADIAHSDLLGKLQVSHEGVLRRDDMVFTMARDFEIPCLAVLSGAYGPHAAEVISNSLSHCIQKTESYQRISTAEDADRDSPTNHDV